MTAPLTARLFPDAADLAERSRLAADPQLPARELAQLLTQAAGWAPLRDFLQRGVEERSPTLVYGDYDVDGSIASLLMFRWLRAQGLPANYFLPSRFQHGYGLDAGVIEQAASHGYKRLLALDCGTANLDEIARARALGIECAIIDHHTCKDSLPDSLLLNPHVDACLPPLCTAGLVFAVLSALLAEGVGSPVGDELELAGLATMADSVPLVPLSWALAHHGLARLPQTSSFGLAELLKVSRLHGLSRLTGRQVAFDIVPRLNAAGRMSSAKMIVELLLAPDAASARQFALRIDGMNADRKDVTRQVTDQANAQALLHADLHGLVLHDESWHPGVLGIVAARVAETHKKPVVILGDAPGDSALWSGSVRSHAGLDVIAALNCCGEHLASFGGHSAAAGVKLARESLDAFRSAWSEAVQGVRTAAAVAASEASQTAPVQANLGELTEQFECDLWDLAPYGVGHSAPRFVLTGTVVRADYMGADRTHAAVTLTDGTRQARLAAFGMSHLATRLRPGDKLAALIECEPDNWNNRCGIMLRLIDTVE